MKKEVVFPILLSIFLLYLLGISCSDTNNSSSDTIQNQVINTVSVGTWRVALFEESGTDETSHFTGYNFTFGTNSVLTASNGANVYVGTWSVTDSNSNDDSLADLDFNISFSSPNDFVDLTDDWDILERTPSKIRLIDVSGGNGGTDYLTFEKN